MQPKQKRPRFHPRSDKGGSHAMLDTPRSDKGGSHQRPTAPRSERSDIGLCHQTSLLPRSEWSDLPLPVEEGSCPSSESLLTRSVRSDKGSTHHKSSVSWSSLAALSAAQIYGKKYQSELRFLTCACCAFEGPRSGYRLLSDLKAKGCLSWHRRAIPLQAY